jgi:membrane protein YqaA with SNARE-associated domain
MTRGEAEVHLRGMDVVPAPPGEARRELLKLGLKFLLGAAALVALVSFLGHTFRPQLESMGRTFVDRFGYVGIGLGTFLADGLHCPVPPQFYMLASIASGRSVPWTLVAVCIGSLLGGIAAYTIASKASHWRFLRRLLARSQKSVGGLFERYGYWAVAIGSVSPLPYSFLCYLSGVYRMPPRIFLALSLFRIPKVVFYFYLVKLGWGHGG